MSKDNGRGIEIGPKFVKKIAVATGVASVLAFGADQAKGQESSDPALDAMNRTPGIVREVASSEMYFADARPENSVLFQEDGTLQPQAIEIVTPQGVSTEIIGTTLESFQNDARYEGTLNIIQEVVPLFQQYTTEQSIVIDSYRIVVSGDVDSSGNVIPTPTPEPLHKAPVYFSFVGGGVFFTHDTVTNTWNPTRQSNNDLLLATGVLNNPEELAPTVPESEFGTWYILPNIESETLQVVDRSHPQRGVVATGIPTLEGNIDWESRWRVEPNLVYDVENHEGQPGLISVEDSLSLEIDGSPFELIFEAQGDRAIPDIQLSQYFKDNISVWANNHLQDTVRGRGIEEVHIRQLENFPSIEYSDVDYAVVTTFHGERIYIAMGSFFDEEDSSILYMNYYVYLYPPGVEEFGTQNISADQIATRSYTLSIVDALLLLKSGILDQEPQLGLNPTGPRLAAIREIFPVIQTDDPMWPFPEFVTVNTPS